MRITTLILMLVGIMLCTQTTKASQPTKVSYQSFDTLGYKKADSIALATPYKRSITPQKIAIQLTQSFKNDGTEDSLKMRTIFRWIAEHIVYDVISYKTGKFKDQSAISVLRNKMAVCAGYAKLTLALCEYAGIECKLIDGYAKGASYNFGQKIPKETNHAWNVVKINQKWRLIDVTWGAGSLTAQGKFGKELSNAYFLGAPENFILDHFPKDPTWQLLSSPVSITQFEQSAQVYYTIPFTLISPQKGTLKKNKTYTFEVFTTDAASAAVIINGAYTDMTYNPVSHIYTATITLTKISQNTPIKIGLRRHNDYFSYDIAVIYRVK